MSGSMAIEGMGIFQRQPFEHHCRRLLRMLVQRDIYLMGHVGRVAAVAERIGRRMHLPSTLVYNLRWAAWLHDVGKITLAPQLQNKPGPLTPKERRIIGQHVRIGCEMVSPFAPDDIVGIMENHHTYYAGNGIPQRYLGEGIPMGARILAMADAFDALTYDRPYHRGVSTRAALGEICKCTGTQFDPAVLRAFLGISQIGGAAELVQRYKIHSASFPLLNPPFI